MPALDSSLVREMRRLAAARAAFPGTPPQDSAELLSWYEGRRARSLAPSGAGSTTLSRRDLLKGGAALTAGMVAGASGLGPLGARRARAQDANVVIVGAGLAGLTCAYRLGRLGIASKVYEAQPRIGGRCWTIRVFENHQTAEHGGQYIDTRHVHIRSLVRELGLRLVDTFQQSLPTGERSFLWLDGAFRDPDVVFADFDVFAERLEADFRRIGPYFYDRASREAVEFDRMTEVEWMDENLPGGSTSLLGRAIGRSNASFWGLDPEDLSAINLLEFYVAPYPGADERYRVAGGNDRIVERLAEELPAGTIRRQRPLEAIWPRTDGRFGLRFSGRRRDVVADAVVLAIPFTALRETDIARLGISRRRRRAIHQLAMGTNSKLQLQLERSFAALNWTGAFGSDEPQYGTWDSTYGQNRPAPDTPVLTIYTGGRAGAQYPTNQAHGRAPDDIVQNALGNLARGVAGIQDAYNGIAYLDSWVDDPWVRGSYAGFRPGQYTDFWGLLAKRKGNLIFAGEHTSTHSQGYLNGGVQSGERAARQLLRILS